jgi:hypothetical protein
VELVDPSICERVLFVAPAINPVVALLAPTGFGETCWKETIGVLNSGTNGPHPYTQES